MPSSCNRSCQSTCPQVVTMMTWVQCADKEGHGSNLKMRKMLIGYKQTRTSCDRDVWMNVDKDTDDIDVDMKINMT